MLAFGPGCAGATSAGRVGLLDRSGERRNLIGSGARALGRDGDGLLVVAQGRVRVFGPYGDALPDRGHPWKKMYRRRA